MARAHLPFSAYATTILAVVFCVGLSVSAWSGDGSGASNAGLLRGTVGSGCANAVLCDNLALNPVAKSVIGSASKPLPLDSIYPPSSAVSIPGNCAAIIAAQLMTPECAQADLNANRFTVRRAPQKPALPQKLVRKSAPVPATQPVILKNAPIARTKNVERLSSDPLVVGSVDRPQSTGGGGFEFNDDAIVIDWSVGLRGGMVINNAGHTFEAVTVPRASVVFQQSGGQTSLTADTELTQSSDGSFRVGSGNIGISTQRAFNRGLTGTAGLTASLAQEAGTTASNTTITTQPFIATGTFTAGLAQNFGRASLGVNGQISRQYVSETGLTDGTWTDNTNRARWAAGLTARAAYKLSPIVSVFGEATTRRDMFDAASPSLGVVEDAWTYEARGGFSGVWRNGISGEIFGGYALRQFDSTSLTEAGGWIYGGSLAYSPQNGISLSAGLTSAVAPAGNQSGASARFDHALALSASYLVTDRFTARASGGANWTTFSASSATEDGYYAGIGADFRLNKNTVLNADYRFSHENAGATQDDIHRLTLGAILSR